MKRLKTYNKFRLLESNEIDFDINVVESMLLDYTDDDIKVRLDSGIWRIKKEDVYWFRIDIGEIGSYKEFDIKESVLDVIDYLKDYDLVLMDESWFSNNKWQDYIGCPNCLSDDIKDNPVLMFIVQVGKTKCNNCGHVGPCDTFLNREWPVDRDGLKESIKEGRKVNRIQLTFSERKSLVKENNEYDISGFTKEIKTTVSDMLLDLSFKDIRASVSLGPKNVYVQLRKLVKDKSSAVLWGDREDNRSYDFNDVKVTIDEITEYLSEWGFKPSEDWNETPPNTSVRSNWYDNGGHGYDTTMNLMWIKK